MTDEKIQKEIQEEIRIRAINERAFVHLNSLLQELDEETVSGDELLARLYAHMLAGYICGYAPHAMVEDARKASDKIISAVEKEIEG
jgi:hypothetical protein